MENKNMRKLDMKSKSNIEASLKYLSEKIPNIFVETDNGLKIDFELLKQELSEEIIDNTEERFQLNWVGKKQSIIKQSVWDFYYKFYWLYLFLKFQSVKSYLWQSDYLFKSC